MAILLVSLVLAGVVSFYAASTPDGLTKVSEDQGFARTETTHESDGSPLAGYQTDGVANGRLSGGLAGVAGVLVVLALGSGVMLLVRRRPHGGEADAEADAPDSERV
ncbi:PDGLE domain-containing protein [Nocardioides sp. CBS4Y-1]|uniref:PDGLE domain-containing protein n=1 Tax=Nocardioides acrostichi TaxID=2784339 RepID=A0A930UW03_9ACTN|nr:PDGLE domain-containing protein [Nocardioides acrostichi]